MALFTDHSGFTSDDRPVHCTYISGSGLIFSVILLALPWLVVTCFRANHCLSSFSIPLLILFSSPANHDQPFFTRERRLPLLPASALRLDSVFFPPDVSTTTNSPETLNTVPLAPTTPDYVCSGRDYFGSCYSVSSSIVIVFCAWSSFDNALSRRAIPSSPTDSTVRHVVTQWTPQQEGFWSNSACRPNLSSWFLFLLTRGSRPLWGMCSPPLVVAICDQALWGDTGLTIWSYRVFLLSCSFLATTYDTTFAFGQSISRVRNGNGSS